MESKIRQVKGGRDPLSNSYNCPFTFQNISFNSANHAYYYQKALHFRNFELANLVYYANSGQKVMELAQRLPKNNTVWKQIRFQLMESILREKMVQPQAFRTEMTKAQGKLISCASPDRFWGNSRNLLGTLLMKMSKRAFQKAEVVPTETKSSSPEIHVDLGEFPPLKTTHQPTKTKTKHAITQTNQKENLTRTKVVKQETKSFPLPITRKKKQEKTITQLSQQSEIKTSNTPFKSLYVAKKSPKTRKS